MSELSEAATARRAVHVWPDDLASALADLSGETCGLNGGLTVISRALPPSANRVEARAAIRQAVTQTLAAFFNQPVASVTLTTFPGQALRVTAPGAAPVFVSISHMAGLSVAAISTGGPVGVDVMAVEAVETPMPPDWELVALDYLGPPAAAALQHTAPAEQAQAFARAWVSWEARLKCLGLGLTEWTPSLALRLSVCDVQRLTLPPGCCGALARR